MVAAIEASAPAAALRTSFVAYPLVNAAHVLGAGALVTLVWLMHRAAAGRDAHPANEMVFRRGAVVALCLMAVTGLALFSVKAGEYADNPAFRIKMGLILLALVNVAAFHALARGRRVSRRFSVFVSILVWPAVLVAGRFIGFV